MADNVQLNRANAVAATGPTAARKPAPASTGDAFSSALDSAQLKFSTHAQKRLDSRDITLTDDGLARLSVAVDNAAQRGGKNSLVLMDDLAFIVNVPNRTVVTALNQQQRGAGVFTQIDSVVLADKKV
jgi:flagellar operon protein